VRGHIGRSDGRETKPLPGRVKQELPEDFRDWKWMFRISRNWRTGESSRFCGPPSIIIFHSGRCSVERLHAESELPMDILQAIKEPRGQGAHVLLAGSLTIAGIKTSSPHPELLLASPSYGMHALSCHTPRSQAATRITALAMDQSPPFNHHVVRLAVFLSTGEIIVFSINLHQPERSIRQLNYLPVASMARTAPIIQAAFHGQLLATLSQSFHLSLYDLGSGTITHKQTLTSFTSHPPSSLVLTPAGDSTYKLVIIYAIPVFPEHWTVGATELIISTAASFVAVSSSRTIRAYDVPSGWIDEHKLRLMREQWGRKVARVSDTQTDGKWVVLAPGDRLPLQDDSESSDDNSDAPSSGYVASRLHSPSSLQLYRLSFPSSNSASSLPKLSYVRSLHGQIGPVTSLALADGRCVSLAANGSIWVWDLEAGTGAEVSAGYSSFASEDVDSKAEITMSYLAKGHVVFDERRIVSSDTRGVEVRRFDI
jgi:hypothetical protein